ncbi:MAG: CDP-glycerol glycerophosphotransferase family protein [Microthrixaceae bacterium]
MGSSGTTTALGRVALGLAQRLLRALTSLLPRDPNRWVFGSRNGAYVDNPRYLFEYLAERHDGTTVAWISPSVASVDQARAGGRRRAWRRRSLRGKWEVLRAGVAVYAFDPSDVNVALTGGALGVNLYHGVPLKAIEDDVRIGPSGRIYHPTTLVERFRAGTVYYPRTLRNDLVLATSPEVAAIMERSFGTRAAATVVARPPRLAAASPRRRRPTTEASTLLYAPTWRPDGGWRIEEALPRLADLDLALQASNATLLVKGHLYDKIELSGAAERIESVPADTDITWLLGAIDGLITDYSSVMFDAALLEVPVVFYPYDLDRYHDEVSPTFNFDYERLVDGRVAWNFEDLLELIGSGRWRTSAFPAEVRNRVWGPGPLGSIEASNDELVAHISEAARRRHGSQAVSP